MKFLTGSEIVPHLFPERISINFKYGCEANFKYYSTVSICAVSIRIPVRINNDEKMNRTFIEALLLDMGFGRI